MHLNGRHYRREELVDLTGDIDQLGGVTAATLSDGPGAGVGILTVRSPSGLSFVCVPGRGLDIGWADWAGMPLAWRSPAGDVAAAFAEQSGQGWLRSFGGGLLTTCGLSAVGQPSIDGMEALGLHGRYSTTPAHQVAWSVDWAGDDRVARITGRVREASAVGPVLELHRTITTTLGSATLRVDDVVTNIGAVPAPHMFRYHLNVGFPLVDERSRLSTPHAETMRTNQDTVNVPNVWDPIGAPLLDGAEQVFTVDPSFTTAGVAILRNDAPRPSLEVRWSVDTLPRLVVWRQPTRRTYVTAIEPSNCDDRGRAAARAAGTLLELQPDEQMHHWVEVSIRQPEDGQAMQAAAPIARQGITPQADHRRSPNTKAGRPHA